MRRSKGLIDVTNTVRWIFIVISLVLLASSLFLIVNTIRLATFARRREIEVMKLVGASNWFVRVPFIAEGMVQGIVGRRARHHRGGVAQALGLRPGVQRPRQLLQRVLRHHGRRHLDRVHRARRSGIVIGVIGATHRPPPVPPHLSLRAGSRRKSERQRCSSTPVQLLGSLLLLLLMLFTLSAPCAGSAPWPRSLVAFAATIGVRPRRAPWASRATSSRSSSSRSTRRARPSTRPGPRSSTPRPSGSGSTSAARRRRRPAGRGQRPPRAAQATVDRLGLEALVLQVEGRRHRRRSSQRRATTCGAARCCCTATATARP